jgi:hypothetical protein
VRLLLAVLAFSTVLAAQKGPSKGTDMETAQSVSIQEWTDAITARLVAQWEGWKNQDPVPNSAIVAVALNRGDRRGF